MNCPSCEAIIDEPAEYISSKPGEDETTIEILLECPECGEESHMLVELADFLPVDLTNG